MKKVWTRQKDENYVKVYIHDITGEIRCVYPKAPKWAQRVAVQIWEDVERHGFATKKGVKHIVKGVWAKMISEAAKDAN